MWECVSRGFRNGAMTSCNHLVTAAICSLQARQERRGHFCGFEVEMFAIHVLAKSHLSQYLRERTFVGASVLAFSRLPQDLLFSSVP